MRRGYLVAMDATRPTELRVAALARQWRLAGDGRHLFADTYAIMTAAMVAGVTAGSFRDNPWVAHLVERFTDYYLDAVHGVDSGGGCPPAWTAAFEACSHGGQHPLQLVLLGINAHINNDLVFALADVMPDWSDLDEDARDARRQDYLAVNDIIASLVDSMQEELINADDPLLGIIDRLLGPSDEWLFRRLVTSWRDAAWDDGCSLLVSVTEDERQQVREAVALRASRTGRLISAL